MADGFSGDTKTRGSRRPVVLTGMAVDALERHRERQSQERETAGELWKDPSLVFANTVGGPIWGEDLLKRCSYPLLERAGIRRIRFHDLRHSTALFLLACGVSSRDRERDARTQPDLDYAGSVLAYDRDDATSSR
jgi:integrase